MKWIAANVRILRKQQKSSQSGFDTELEGVAESSNIDKTTDAVLDALLAVKVAVKVKEGKKLPSVTVTEGADDDTEMKEALESSDKKNTCVLPEQETALVDNEHAVEEEENEVAASEGGDANNETESASKAEDGDEEDAEEGDDVYKVDAEAGGGG